MTPEQIKSCNKFLCGWEDKCWHEFDELNYVCINCKHNIAWIEDHNGTAKNPNYFTAEGCFGENGLWNKAKEDKHSFEDFMAYKFNTTVPRKTMREIVIEQVDFNIFPLEWAKFLGF